MTLPSSGPLSIQQIASEFGRATNMGAFYGAAAGIPTAGQISISQFYGKAAGGEFVFNLTLGNRGTNTNWTVPADVTSVCILLIGMGAADSDAGGGGGALAYKNNIAVTPGQVLQISNSAGQVTIFRSGVQLTYAQHGKTRANGGTGGAWPGVGTFADGGGNGGNAGSLTTSEAYAAGGGGAGGYAGNGGNGSKAPFSTAATAGAGGGGGGGGSIYTDDFSRGRGRGGGGVGMYGIGGSGAAGVSGASATSGQGGSGGANGGTTAGGQYGGGGGIDAQNSGSTGDVNLARGVVRIIWGAGRSFPSNAA